MLFRGKLFVLLEVSMYVLCMFKYIHTSIPAEPAPGETTGPWWPSWMRPRQTVLSLFLSPVVVIYFFGVGFLAQCAARADDAAAAAAAGSSKQLACIIYPLRRARLVVGG
jgi:hypothetical protein